MPRLVCAFIGGTLGRASGTSAAVVIMELSANLFAAYSAYRNSRTLCKREWR